MNSPRAMLRAYTYLQAVSVYNGLRVRLLRLRQPKYLFGALAGGAYVYFFAFRHLFEHNGMPGVSVSGGAPAAFLPVLVSLFAAVLLVLTVLAWLLPGGRAALAFTEAEVAFLFPAPLSRVSLIQFSLLRSQLAIFFSAFIMSLLVRRGGALGGHAVQHAFAIWLVLATARLHLMGASFARERLLAFGVRPWLRRIAVSALVLVAAVACWWWIATHVALPGKQDLADADAAWECVKSLGLLETAAACVIVKHANPCGAALADTPLAAYRNALATDPVSSFGGIVAFNRPVDAKTLEAVSAQFLEVLIAPGYTAGALAVITRKKQVRVLEVALAARVPAPQVDLKRIGGGLLLQTTDVRNSDLSELKTVTRIVPSAAQLRDLLFVWHVAKFVKSNAIVYGGSGRTLGIGAGQMSRVDSTRIAAAKAKSAGLSLAGSVVASDAFFPFRDGLDVVADNGAVAVIQPGGSVRDDEVIAAADERGIAMVFTGIRHFRH